ncbi:MAG: FHA domain-containing protein [Bacteroidota bacterium]
MGILFFAGRLLLLMGLYALAIGAARRVWLGIPGGREQAAVVPGTVHLRLVQAAGEVTANGRPWLPGAEVALALPVTFGRQAGNAVMLEDPFVSSCHAELMTDGTAVWLVDRGSKNGTWMGRRRLERPVRTEPGGEFRLSGTVIRFEG